MKPIVLRHFNCDSETEYAVLNNTFSFDYEVVGGVTFVSFYNEDKEEVMQVDSMYEISEFVDFDIINDEDYCIAMEDIIVETVQGHIEEYLTNDDDVLDLNAVKTEISERLSTHYKEFFDKKYEGRNS